MGGRSARREGGHVELITHLQLLVGHGGQSRHVEGEVAGGGHVHLGILSLVVGPHGKTLGNQGHRGGPLLVKA